ncbi:hypothetical protein CYMTET_25930 [Cymbomonas tetramitiformis]|uniref:JmjC domain-containing protein n=1 Tax=Cymbomonas tetramitiformis TaxID=36881 RepID=A0AAE0KYJ7_9CHLO|nr:hypothetical protein CYMTET_25930 [Cymbomonas tetramitiformis]
MWYVLWRGREYRVETSGKTSVLERLACVARLRGDATCRPCLTDAFGALLEPEPPLTMRSWRIYQALIGCTGDTLLSPKEMSAANITTEWMRNDGLRVPVFISAYPTAAMDLGMEVPSGLTVAAVGSVIGPRHSISTVNVSKQVEGPLLTMGDWMDYWATPPEERPQVLKTSLLPVAGSPLEQRLRAPAAIRGSDLAYHAWPEELGGRPQVQSNVLMSVEGSHRDFALDVGGASVWYHMLSGHQVFLMAPPTRPNLSAFVKWSIARRRGVAGFFGELAGGMYRCEVKAGETLLVPGGWVHATAALQDSVAVGGHFLHGDCPLFLRRLPDCTPAGRM